MFKFTQPELCCCYCNTYSGPFHVDHKTVPFSKIKDDFLKNVKLSVPKTFQKNSIYFNGAKVLKVLKENPKLNLLDLFQLVKLQKDMDFAVFILCLDWLYLVDFIILNKEGEIELCS
jgi:hypothetical protein